MAERTLISWADSTLNVWMGCQETGSPACVGCYARQLVEGRFGLTTWGPHGKRVETKSWRANLRKISRLAKAADRPWFVFVNSLSDFWDNQADPKLREAALDEFRKHPHLTFLLVTKRPQNILKMAKKMVDAGLGPYATDEGIRSWWPRNVALLITVVTQEEADRDIPWLVEAAEALRPAFTGLSMEPLAERVVIDRWMSKIGWVIVGGGTDQGKVKAYESDPDWFRELLMACTVAGVPFHMKQMTRKAPVPPELQIQERPAA